MIYYILYIISMGKLHTHWGFLCLIHGHVDNIGGTRSWTTNPVVYGRLPQSPPSLLDGTEPQHRKKQSTVVLSRVLVSLQSISSSRHRAWWETKSFTHNLLSVSVVYFDDLFSIFTRELWRSSLLFPQNTKVTIWIMHHSFSAKCVICCGVHPHHYSPSIKHGLLPPGPRFTSKDYILDISYLIMNHHIRQSQGWVLIKKVYKTMILPKMALVLKLHSFFPSCFEVLSDPCFSVFIHIPGEQTCLGSAPSVFLKYGWWRKVTTVATM